MEDTDTGSHTGTSRVGKNLMSGLTYVVVQFYPWFTFYFLSFLGIVMYGNEFETKENKIWSKDKIEPQHIQQLHGINKRLRSY